MIDFISFSLNILSGGIFQTRDDFLGMVELDLSCIHIPRENPQVLVPEKSLPLQPRSERSHVSGSISLSFSYLFRDTSHSSVSLSPDEDSNHSSDSFINSPRNLNEASALPAGMFISF